MTCGQGRETRYVACMIMTERGEEMTTESECDVSIQPTTEQACHMTPCANDTVSKFDISSSNRVIISSHWRAGPWGGVSIPLHLVY